MNNTCVIFAASIFDRSRLDVLHDFFSAFKTHFSDADFYVGINYGTLPELEDEIKKYGLNVNIVRLTNENLYTRTDASAYQAALKLLKNSGKKYDIYWFAHTKGGVNHRPAERQMYIDEMITQRKPIEEMFEKYPHLGSWGIRGNSISGGGVNWYNYNVDVSFPPICRNVPLPWCPYDHVNWSYIETLYVLKKEAVETWFKYMHDDFFTTKLDGCYFETVPGWFPTRLGFFPYVKRKRDFFDRCDLTDITREWIDQDPMLQHLLPYLEI